MNLMFQEFVYKWRYNAKRASYAGSNENQNSLKNYQYEIQFRMTFSHL